MTNVTGQQEEDAWLEMPGIEARDLKRSQTGWSLCPDKLGQYQGPSYSALLQERQEQMNWMQI